MLFHGSWTRDLSSFGSYAFVLASVMVFIQTSAEIQIERAKKLYVDEFESENRSKRLTETLEKESLLSMYNKRKEKILLVATRDTSLLDTRARLL